jgi:hypothetical protein
MLVVPTLPLPNQQLQIQLAAQACELNVYQNAYGLFVDVYLNGQLIVGGVLCLDRTKLIRDTYLGFTGDFAFYDTQDEGLDPVYTGLGSRYQLLYLEAADLA